jgi:hypothetical protein
MTRRRTAMTRLMALAAVTLVAAVGGLAVQPAAQEPAAAVPSGASGGYTAESHQCYPLPANGDGTLPPQIGNGQRDTHGVLWQDCANRVVRDDGSPAIPIAEYLYDVAPAPDGNTAYVMTDVVRRIVRNPATGAWSEDPTWHLEQFSAGGKLWTPQGIGIATDAWGNIYVSNGGWRDGQPNVILKYRPDGQLQTRFGDFGSGDGQFDVNMGIAVTPDGRSVYVADHLNCRVQRFDHRSSDGGYGYAMQWGGCDTSNPTTGKFSAVYDVTLDRQGYVYVADTTWNRVQRFTADGTYVEQVMATPYATAGSHVHYVAVDAAGNILVGETNQLFRRGLPDTAPSPVPTPLVEPDVVKPRLTSVTGPATSASTAVDLQLDASDDVGVAQARWAGNDGTWSSWAPFAPTLHVDLGAAGRHHVSVQLRDEAGNESTIAGTDVDVVLPAPPATTPAPRPVDRTPPRVRRVTVAMRGTTARLTVVATDVGGTVRSVRVRVGSGRWGAWRPIGSRLAIAVPNRALQVLVQVRDSAGNASAARPLVLRRSAGSTR